MSGLELDTTRLTDPTFVSKVNIRERAYTVDPITHVRDYQNTQGNNYTVERLMPTPFMLTLKADIWTSNTDQKLQLLEQILVLFNPSLEIQTTDNYIDWTSLSVVFLKSVTFTSRSIPQGTDSDIDVCTLEFETPIWITPPAKVKKLGIVRNIIANVFAESGDVQNLNDIVYNNERGVLQTILGRARVLLYKSQNGEPYDYDLTFVDPVAALMAYNAENQILKIGGPIDWNTVLDLEGGYKPGSVVHFDQPTGWQLIGNFVVNPLDSNVLVVTFDPDTIPSNTLIPSTINGVEPRGTIDAIIDPYKYSPLEVYGDHDGIPVGIRFLMLDDVNNSIHVGHNVDDYRAPLDGHYDGPDAWKNKNGSDPVIPANSIIEWTGTHWVPIFYPNTTVIPTYVQNLRTGIKYRWTGEEWLKAFEGEYGPGYWGLNLNP